MKMPSRRLTLVLALLSTVVLQAQVPSDRQPDPVATFSILGFDPATGEVGGAVQSRVFSVGNGVLWGELQVDDSPEPLKELRRLVEMNARRFNR